MANSTPKSFSKLTALLCLMLALSGCSLVGAAFVPAAVSGAAFGVEYTFTNTAYKTISYSVADVEAALDKALRKMNIEETGRKAGAGEVIVTAVTENLNIEIDLKVLTPTVTKIEVSAKKGLIFKDKATATEIITQTEERLGVAKR